MFRGLLKFRDIRKDLWYYHGKLVTQTSHIKNKLSTLKNQCFNPQNNNQAALCPYSNASCMYFGSL